MPKCSQLYEMGPYKAFKSMLIWMGFHFILLFVAVIETGNCGHKNVCFCDFVFICRDDVRFGAQHDALCFK